MDMFTTIGTQLQQTIPDHDCIALICCVAARFMYEDAANNQCFSGLLEGGSPHLKLLALDMPYSEDPTGTFDAIFILCIIPLNKRHSIKYVPYLSLIGDCYQREAHT